MEKIKVQKTGSSQYGSYLKDETNKFHSCTPQVERFLKDKCPVEISIDETVGEGRDEKISKTRILSSDSKGAWKSQGDPRRKEASMCVSYAKDLAVAQIIKSEEVAEYAKGFMSLIEELATEPKKEQVIPEAEASASNHPEPPLNTSMNDAGELE